MPPLERVLLVHEANASGGLPEKPSLPYLQPFCNTTLSFTEGLLQLTEMLDLALTLEPEKAIQPLTKRLRQQMRHVVWPAPRLRINRREVKQVYNKHKPKQRDVPPPQPFEPDEQFLDFVLLFDSLAPVVWQEVLK